MYIGYPKYEKIVEDFEQEQKAAQDKFLDQFARLAQKERQARHHIGFTLTYSLHKYMNGLDWFGASEEKEPLLAYSNLEKICVKRELDIEKYATRIDEDTPVGGFLRAWLACDGQPGYGPVALKFLVVDGWMKRINDDYENAHNYPSSTSTITEVQAQVAAIEELCDLFCDIDLRQLRLVLGSPRYYAHDKDIVEKFESLN